MSKYIVTTNKGAGTIIAPKKWTPTRYQYVVYINGVGIPAYIHEIAAERPVN